MAKPVSDERPDDRPDADGRRGFLSKSGMMLALLALAQGSDAALAAAVDTPASRMMSGPAMVSGPEARQVSMFLNSAMRMGKIDTTSPEFLKLAPAVQKSLETLTPGDLQVLARAQQILTSKIKPVADDNNGTIGM